MCLHSKNLPRLWPLQPFRNHSRVHVKDLGIAFHGTAADSKDPVGEPYVKFQKRVKWFHKSLHKRIARSLRPENEFVIPAETARVAHAAFPKANRLMTLRDELGVIDRDSDLGRLFSPTGQPAEFHGRLARVTIVQFAEARTDREAADAVRSRIDLKYLLGLTLEEAGFDFSVRSEFRDHLQTDDTAQHWLTNLLRCLKTKGVLKVREKPRTDSTHVVDAVRTLHRLELVGETRRAAPNQLAGSVPHWLHTHVASEWFERYGERFMTTRLPKTESERHTRRA